MQFKKHDRRQIQIEKQIQESLASFLLKNMNVSRDGLVSVTRVRVPKDLKTAEVYIHQYGKTEAENDELIETLQKKLGLIQKHLTQELKLRFCPRLEFQYDKAFDKTLAVDKLIYDMTRSGVIKKEESSD
jgi:ribosome-binding factor A